MKIYNHDITLYTHDLDTDTRFYSGRALGLTQPDDKIQIHPDLKPEWDFIADHYDQVGLEHSHDVIWDISIAEIDRFPDHEVSVYFFGDVVSSHDKYRQIFERLDARRRQVVEFVNSKNNFISLAEELGVPVPTTLRFETLSAAKACDTIPFPCYVKPAVSDHGFGIMRCPDEATLAKAFSNLQPDEPLQIQAEVEASTFLNLQYAVTENGIEPLLVSEQILDGCVHKGNRYPSRHEPWDEMKPFADWMSDRGMQDIFAVDVAVVPDPEGSHYVAIECNPRFNGSSYPTMVAKRLGIPEWIGATYKTELRSLKDVDLTDLTYDTKTGKGIVLINWGTVKSGKVGVLLAGSEAEQADYEAELEARLKH